MSLLMDALKKAEREREAQASKEQGESDEASQELSLDPMEHSGLETSDDDIAAGEEEPWDILGEGDDPDHGFDLDFDEVELNLGVTDEPEDPTDDASPALADVPLSTAVDDDVSLEDTSSTMPSMKAVKASVDRYFDGSQSSSMSVSMAAVTAADTEQDDATTVVRTRDSEEARAAAKTVFDAKRRRKSRGWIWVPVGLLLVLLLIGGFVFFYFNTYGSPTGGFQDWMAVLTGKPITTTTQTGTTTTVVETQTTTSSLDTQSSTGSADTTLAAAGNAESAEADGAAASEADGLLESLEPELGDVMQVDPPPIGDLTPVEAQSGAEESADSAQPEVMQELPSTEELLASADEQIAQALADESVLSAGGIRDEGFQLTRSAVTPRINPKVLSGYEAFQRNDLATAEIDYRAVLRTNPNNRDALLGLAAIAVKKNRVALAGQIYREILRVDPRDSIAKSALLGLQAAPSTANESQLKLMLDREPDSAHLHFGLGNYYASQARWAEAQNAYFNAFRLDSKNPDYAYNLAIGLDHLAQSEAALEYYRLALELATGTTPGFATAAVKKRIESITQ